MAFLISEETDPSVRFKRFFFLLGTAFNQIDIQSK